MSSTISDHLLSPTQLRELGCTCEFGCRGCGEPEARMGNCPAFNPCPMGREKAKGCPYHGTEKAAA